MKKINKENIPERLISFCSACENNLVSYDLKLLATQIKICEKRIEHLKDNKPHWFEKNKTKAYTEELEELEDKLIYYYEELDKQLAILEK